MVGHAAAATTERVGGADDQWETAGLGKLRGLGQGSDRAAQGYGFADALHQGAEAFAVLAVADSLNRRAQDTYAVFLEDSGVSQIHSQVESRLATHRGQQAIWTFASDHLLDERNGQRLDVDTVGDVLVGHDGGWVRIDQDRADALLPHGLASLGPGVVELGRLADDDGPRTDDQN